MPGHPESEACTDRASWMPGRPLRGEPGMTQSTCAPISSTSTCRPTASRCGRRRRAMRRGCWWCGRAATPELEDRGVRDLPDLLQPGDALVVNDTKVIPARLIGPPHRPRRRAEDRGDADRAARRLALARLRAAGARSSQPGDIVRFGEEGKVCFLGQLDATVEAKGEGGEVTLSFAFHGPVLDQAIAERGDMPLPPYIAAQARARRARPRRLPDAVRARRGLGRGADRGPAFHRRAAGAARGARRRACTRSRCMSGRAPSCR